jgi:hypothetical protein
MEQRQRIGRSRSTNKGGRPSKGPRYARTIRFPELLNDEIEQAATAAGYDSVQDFVVDVMFAARDAGLFPAAAPGQESLPISA